MAIRLQEMHPALVHLPIALLPLAVGADGIGSATGNESALAFGKKAVCIAATGAVASAVTGLIAGEEVNVEDASQDMLITAATDLVHGVQHMVQEVAKGRLVPTIMALRRKQPEVPVSEAAGTPA